MKKDASDWYESQRIRKYIEVVKQAAVSKYGVIASGSELDEWLIWAARQADRLDPLVESPPSILDEPEDMCGKPGKIDASSGS